MTRYMSVPGVHEIAITDIEFSSLGNPFVFTTGVDGIVVSTPLKKNLFNKPFWIAVVVALLSILFYYLFTAV